MLFNVTLTKEQYEYIKMLLNTEADIIDTNIISCEDYDLEYWENRQFLHNKTTIAVDDAACC